MSAEWVPSAEAVEAALAVLSDWPVSVGAVDRAWVVPMRHALTAARPALVAEALAYERERIAQAIEKVGAMPELAAYIARNGDRA